MSVPQWLCEVYTGSPFTYLVGASPSGFVLATDDGTQHLRANSVEESGEDLICCWRLTPNPNAVAPSGTLSFVVDSFDSRITEETDDYADARYNWFVLPSGFTTWYEGYNTTIDGGSGWLPDNSLSITATIPEGSFVGGVEIKIYRRQPW